MEAKGIEAVLHYRVLEFYFESVLFYALRLGLHGEDAERVLLAYILAGTLGSGLAALARHCQLYEFPCLDQLAEGIGLHIIQVQVEGVRLLAGVIDPDLQGVLLRVELAYESLGLDTAYPHGIDLGIRGHEGEIGSPFAYPFLVDYHLLGRFLPEDGEFHLSLSCKAAERVLHIVFLELRQGIVDHGDRAYECVQKGNPLIVRVIKVVPVLVHKGIHPVNRVLYVPEAEEAPFIRLYGRIRTVQEYGRIRLVLVEHHRRSLERLEGIAIHHAAGNHHRVNAFTRREDQREARKHIALIVVAYGVGQVKHVGLGRIQVLFEADYHALAGDFVFRSLGEGRREEETLRVLHHHVFIESEFQTGLVTGHVNCSAHGFHLAYHRRDGILGTARRRSGRIRAGRGEEHHVRDDKSRRQQWQQHLQRFCNFPVHHISVLITLCIPSMLLSFFTRVSSSLRSFTHTSI